MIASIVAVSPQPTFHMTLTTLPFLLREDEVELTAIRAQGAGGQDMYYLPCTTFYLPAGILSKTAIFIETISAKP